MLHKARFRCVPFNINRMYFEFNLYSNHLTCIFGLAKKNKRFFYAIALNWYCCVYNMLNICVFFCFRYVGILLIKDAYELQKRQPILQIIIRYITKLYNYIPAKLMCSITLAPMAMADSCE